VKIHLVFSLLLRRELKNGEETQIQIIANNQTTKCKEKQDAKIVELHRIGANFPAYTRFNLSHPSIIKTPQAFEAIMPVNRADIRGRAAVQLLGDSA
jgi:hypothetical protein